MNSVTLSASKSILEKVDINQDTINNVVNDLVQRLAKYHLSLVNTIKNEIADPDRNQRMRLTDSTSDKKEGLEFFSFPGYPILEKNVHFGEERYFARMRYQIKQIDDSSPLGQLILKLNQRIAEHGFICSQVEVRFEKGCMHSIAPYWHQDEGFKESIVANFSTKDQWSTRILEDGIDPWSISLHNKESLKHPSHPLPNGCLFNAKEFHHRSPKASDIQAEEISQTDYRLFFHFTDDDRESRFIKI